MRILGFQKKWDKLSKPEFTTFRYPRADKDWQVRETVQVVIKPRSKSPKLIGFAEIIRLESHRMEDITESMAIQDGFESLNAMLAWLGKTYGNDYRWLWQKPMNRIILRQIERVSGHE
jgi:hypothetical protein